jgi:hypothetical protein
MPCFSGTSFAYFLPVSGDVQTRVHGCLCEVSPQLGNRGIRSTCSCFVASTSGPIMHLLGLENLPWYWYAYAHLVLGHMLLCAADILSNIVTSLTYAALV